MKFSKIVTVFLATVVGHVYCKMVAPTGFPTENLRTIDDLGQAKSTDTQYAILDCFGEQVYNNLGGSLTDCLLNLVLFKLSHVKQEHFSKFSLFNGLVEFERRKLDDDILTNRMSRSMDFVNISKENIVENLNNLTQDYSVKFNILDGVKLRVSRSLDTVNVGVETDEDEEEEEEDAEDVEDKDDDGRAGLSSLQSGNKKKKKSGVHKKYKQFMAILPMFLIPVFIQATLLPLFLATLKLIAIKSVFIGKLALLLVGYNALRNASIRRKQDDVDEHIAIEHYGYNGDMEYGAMLNSRAL